MDATEIVVEWPEPGWSKLTEDLQVDILCKLPEKPLLRFKCVSKSSNSLVSNVCVPKILASVSGLFYEYYPKMSPPLALWNRRKFLMDYASTTTTTTTTTDYSSSAVNFMDTYRALVPFVNRTTVNHVQDCCNGLILLVDPQQLHVPLKINRYYVLNPATKQCIRIPVKTAHTEIRMAFLAFDPLESPNYKILRLERPTVDCSENKPVEFDVFSSDTGEWGVSTLKVPLSPIVYGHLVRHPIYLKGFLYMLSYRGYLLHFHLNAPNGAIKGAVFELPGRDQDRLLHEVHPGFVGVSKGCFYYLNHADRSSSILIWTLEEENKAGKWILKRTIDTINIDNLVRHRMPKEQWLASTYRRYALHPTSEEIFISIAVIIISYNPLTNEVKLLYESDGERELLPLQYFFFPYSRCLVPLNNFSLPALPWPSE
ncbi:hypothetical protein LguiA_030557 [Lonicera macranthoides]